MPVIDWILKERQADYISMARPFIREPHLIKRWKGGDTTNAKCIGRIPDFLQSEAFRRSA